MRWHPVCLACNITRKNCTFKSDAKFSKEINASGLFVKASENLANYSIVALNEKTGEQMTDFNIWSTALNGNNTSVKTCLYTFTAWLGVC